MPLSRCGTRLKTPVEQVRAGHQTPEAVVDAMFDRVVGAVTRTVADRAEK